jgi:hypothetical protein
MTITLTREEAQSVLDAMTDWGIGHKKVTETVEMFRAKLSAPEPESETQYTYASKQATNCAGCGEYKHTPLRVDKMEGYVCLTCIYKKLGSLLGEFGFPEPEPVAWNEAVEKAVTDAKYVFKDSCNHTDQAIDFMKSLMQSTYHPKDGAAPPQRERVQFPTMLRKMWSGTEVQAWLDENVNKEKNNV